MGHSLIMQSWHASGLLRNATQQLAHTSGSVHLPVVLTGLQSFVNAPCDAHCATNNAAIIVILKVFVELQFVPSP
jgi:hypothetical protein